MTSRAVTSVTGSSPAHFARQYGRRLKNLKLKGRQPKTIDVWARAIGRPGDSFDYRIDGFSEAQLTEYLSTLLGTKVYGCWSHYSHE